jgi:hypothetical protein
MVPLILCREGRIDAKMARREAAKDRGASPDVTHVPGGGNVFGGDDSFQAAKERYEALAIAGAVNTQGYHHCFIWLLTCRQIWGLLLQRQAGCVGTVVIDMQGLEG